MEAAAADLLAALSSPSRAGLHSRFAAYLHPFSPHLLAANPPTPDAAAARPLAKRFLPFLSRALHLLPPLLRQNPSSVSASDADELLEIYGLLLDCLAAISPCLAGKPYSVLLQRGRFVCCLQSRGHYARAEAEAAATLDALRCALSPAAIGAASLLPEPAGVAGEDPEITTLAVELTVCLANCASKAKVKEAGPYQRVLLLVEQLRPWLRILTEESSRKKYLTLLVDALSRCVVFLAAEPPFFDEKLVREFCVATLGVARKICSSYCRPSARKEGPIITEDLPKDTLKGITDAFARIAKMIDILHKCGSKVTQDIIVKILSESLVYGDTSDYHKSYLVLIKLWVKITLKDFEDDQRVDSATLLYHSLMACSPPLPVKLIGLIVEQELLAYGAMESRVTMLGANMQNRIIDILLNEIYCSKEYYLNRSKVLVRKARILRASGVQNISSCLESLSEAISLLRDILLDSSRDNAIVIYELAIAYCLHAHCAQEANHGGKVIFDDARSVVDLWSKMDTLHHCSPGVIFQQPPETLVPLLCSLVDLLAVKGCFELQFELCKLIIIVWKQENLPLEKLFSMLFINGRLNHACCHLPMDQKFVSYVAQHLDVDCHSMLFWRNCFKEDYPSLTMFLQRLWPVDFFSQSCEHSFGNQFGFNASVDEIDKVASSLVSEGPMSNQYLAGCIYYDLSERLLSRGQVLQAISYGREALQLRKKLLKKKFKFNLGKFVSGQSQCSHG